MKKKELRIKENIQILGFCVNNMVQVLHKISYKLKFTYFAEVKY